MNGGWLTPLQLPGPRVGPELSPEVWNALFGWIPAAEPVSSATAPPAYAILVYVLAAGLVVFALRRALRVTGVTDGATQEVREADLSAMLEEQRRESGAANAGVGAQTGPGATDAGEGRTLGDLGERHQNLLAPPEIETDTREPRFGEQYAKTFVVGEFPDFPTDGFLEDLFSLTDAQFDVTTYIHTLNQPTARASLRRRADNLQSKLNTSPGASRMLAEETEYMTAAADAAESGQAVFDVSMYVTVRGDTREELQANERAVRKALRDDPADLTLDMYPGKQLLALQSADPLGPDVMRNSDPERYSKPALAGAVGALLASPHNPTIIEPGGYEFGLHKETQTPVIADPFQRENGHAVGVFGDPGAGKSASSKSNFLEFVTQRDDVIGIIIEPLGNWEGIIEAANHNTPEEYQAEHIPVGGDRGINPLEIQPAADLSQTSPERGNPLREKEGDVLSFITNFFALRGLRDGFAEHRTEFEAAVRDAWEDAGITEDPATHDREDPTLRDVMDQLEARVENPEDYVARHESEAESIRESARWLLRQLGPFEPGGRYNNLGRQSEIDLRGSDIVYLDLGQEEGNVSEKATLSMQLLISLVYQRAKQTDKKVVLAMDEFRYILQDAADLGFMETLFRHHRHHEISPWIMTQTVDEFFASESAQAILDMCTIKQFHKLEGMDEDWANEFRFGENVMRAIQEAQPGSEERGYSDAVVGIDDEWRSVEVHIPDGEFDVIEYDPDDDPVTQLPGVTNPTPDTHEQTDAADQPVADGRGRTDSDDTPNRTEDHQ